MVRSSIKIYKYKQHNRPRQPIIKEYPVIKKKAISRSDATVKYL